MSTEQIAPSEQQTIRAASDARLRTIFGAAIVWVIDEQYDANGPVWQVTLVCQSEAARWMKRRYRYDIPSDTMHFTGEQPVSDAELLAARRGGRRL